MRYIFEAILIYAAATLLLRISGRKSISQLTIPETVLMISIGTLLIQPIPGYGIGLTLAVCVVLVAALMGMEYLQFKFSLLESAVSARGDNVLENELEPKKSPNLGSNIFAEAVTGEPSPSSPDRLQ